MLESQHVRISGHKQGKNLPLASQICSLYMQKQQGLKSRESALQLLHNPEVREMQVSSVYHMVSSS